jgi:hypothetical protein
MPPSRSILNGSERTLLMGSVMSPSLVNDVGLF